MGEGAGTAGFTAATLTAEATANCVAPDIKGLKVTGELAWNNGQGTSKYKVSVNATEIGDQIEACLDEATPIKETTVTNGHLALIKA